MNAPNEALMRAPMQAPATAAEPNDVPVAAALGPAGFYEGRGRNGVLLIHGITGAPVEMRYLARNLARQGFTVACPQLAGHCETLQAVKKTDWHDWYESVERGFEFLSERCDHVFVTGLCMGALLAMQLAADKKARVSGLATLSAAFVYDGWNVWHFGRRFLLPLALYTPLKHFWSYHEPPPYGIKDERMRSLIEAMYSGREVLRADQAGYSEFPGVTIAETYRLMRATKRRLGAVASPTLVVHSTEDDMASANNAHYIAKRLGSRHVETYLVDDCYHVLTIDRRRDEIGARMGRFFRDAVSRRATPVTES